MKVTEEQGSKKAQCPKCKQVVLIPSESARPSRRRAPADSGSITLPPQALPAGEPTQVVGARPDRASGPGSETQPGMRPAIYDLPTRIERVRQPEPPDLPAFLAPPEAPDEIGRLGPYRVLEVVGSGGMGVVYRAEDIHLQRLVALKVMLPALAASPVARERFLREARAAAGIQHDHIVPIYQISEVQVPPIGAVPYLAMPFLQGEPLDARLRRAREGGPTGLPLGEVVYIGRQIAEGLAAIHERGLIHRDIKPANVWLETLAGDPGGGPRCRVKILDFGLAREVGGDAQLTQADTIVGSPAYMAPEQATRQPLDARADLFSLGCVLYLLCTGELAFQGNDALTTLLAITSTTPPAPRERAPTVPAALSNLVMRLLAKKPDDRPGSARAVVEELRVIESGEREVV
jgi:serine/threonine protein kinase